MTESGDDLSPFEKGETDTPQNETSEGAESISAPSGSSGEDFSKFEEDMGPDPLVLKIQGELEQVKDELARSRAETYNVRQEYGNYVRRSKDEAGQRKAEGRVDVVEALLPVLDDIAAARAAGDLAEGPFASIAEKLETTLANNYKLVQYGEVGDSFDPEHHDALMMQPNPDPEVTEQVVGQVLQPGYEVDGRVLRPAKVLVFDPR